MSDYTGGVGLEACSPSHGEQNTAESSMAHKVQERGWVAMAVVAL